MTRTIAGLFPERPGIRRSLPVQEEVTAFEKTLALKPRYSEARMRKGVSLYNLGRYGEAIRDLRTPAENPHNFHAWYQKGRALFDSGDYTDAIEAYDHALEIESSYPDADYHKGLALYELGRYEEAILSFDQALESDPHIDGAIFHRGASLLKLERYREAVQAFDQTLLLLPKYAPRIISKVLPWPPRVCIRTPSMRMTVPLNAIRKSAESAFNKAMSLHNLGQDEDALSAIGRATDLQKDFTEAWRCRKLSFPTSEGSRKHLRQRTRRCHRSEKSQPSLPERSCL